MHPFTVDSNPERTPLDTQYGYLTHQLKGLYKGLNVTYFKTDSVSSSWNVEKLALKDLMALRYEWFKRFYWNEEFYLSGKKCLEGEANPRGHFDCRICELILLIRHPFDKINERNKSQVCVRVDSLFQTVFTAGIFYLHTLMDPDFRSEVMSSSHCLFGKCLHLLRSIDDDSVSYKERLKNLNIVIATLGEFCFADSYPHLVNYLQRGLKEWRCDLLQHRAPPQPVRELTILDSVKGLFTSKPVLSQDDIQQSLYDLFGGFKFLCEMYRYNEARSALQSIYAGTDTKSQRASIKKKQALLVELEDLCKMHRRDYQDVGQQQRFLKALNAMRKLHEVQGRLRPLPLFARTLILLPLTLSDDLVNAFDTFVDRLKEGKEQTIGSLKTRRDFSAPGSREFQAAEEALSKVFEALTELFIDAGYVQDYLWKKTLNNFMDLIYHGNTQILADGIPMGLGQFDLSSTYEKFNNGDVDPEDEFEKLIPDKMNHAYMHPVPPSSKGAQEKRVENAHLLTDLQKTFSTNSELIDKDTRRLGEHLSGYGLRDNGGFERRTGLFYLMNVKWGDVATLNGDSNLIVTASRFMGVMTRTGHRLTKTVPFQFSPYTNAYMPPKIADLFSKAGALRVTAFPFETTLQLLRFMEYIQNQIPFYKDAIVEAQRERNLPIWLMNDVAPNVHRNYDLEVPRNANAVKQELDEKLSSFTLLCGKVIAAHLFVEFKSAEKIHVFTSFYESNKERFKAGFFGRESLRDLRNELDTFSEEKFKVDCKKTSKLAFAVLSEFNYALNYQMVLNIFRFTFETNWWYQSMVIASGDILPHVRDLTVRQFGEGNLEESKFHWHYRTMKKLEPNHPEF